MWLGPVAVADQELSWDKVVRFSRVAQRANYVLLT